MKLSSRVLNNSPSPCECRLVISRASTKIEFTGYCAVLPMKLGNFLSLLWTTLGITWGKVCELLGMIGAKLGDRARATYEKSPFIRLFVIHCVWIEKSLPIKTGSLSIQPIALNSVCNLRTK